MDSKIPVNISTGLFYISSPLIAVTPGSVKCSPVMPDYVDGTVSVTNHTRIYTDKDVSILIIRTKDFVWSGGIFDVIKAASYTSDVVKYDCTYSIYQTHVFVRAYASKTKLLAGNVSGNGLHFDQENATQAGYILDVKAEVFSYYLSRGFYISDKPALIATVVSHSSVICNTWGCKKSVEITDDSDANTLKIMSWNEAVNVCSYAESLLPAIYVGGYQNIIDCALYDYGLNAPPLYSNAIKIVNAGDRNQYINHSMTHDLYGNEIVINKARPLSSTFLENPDNLLIGHATGRRPIISDIQNQFAWLLKHTPTTTVVVYDGEGYDFDANLDPSTALSAGTAMTISNLSTIFQTRTEKPLVSFNSTTKITTDFLEIVIP
jgi:hypothetical protein